MLDLENDPRWRRLQTQGIPCSTCDQIHVGVFDLGLARPDLWPISEGFSPNSAVEVSDNFCSEDFCILGGEHYFIRCLLELPIVGAGEQKFGYGVWSSLSEDNFRLYVDHFDDGDLASLGPWFGWFSNRLNGYPDTTSLKCQIHPQGDHQRPSVELEANGHPLSDEQINGIGFDRFLEIYTLNGHDMDNVVTD